MKLFVATYPNTECDDFVAEICFKMSLAYKCGMKQMPEERDANYYFIDFGKSQSMAEATERRIKAGPKNLGNFTMSGIIQSVYGLYRTDVLSSDISLEDYINMK